MKKIILITMTVITVISLFALNVFAMSEVPYTNVIEFNETKKAYPIAETPETAVGFFEYYQSDNVKFNTKSNEYGAEMLYISARKYEVVISIAFSGDRPNWDYSVDNPTLYTDFAIISYNGAYRLYGSINGVYTEIVNFDDIDEISEVGFGVYTTAELTNGYYVDFPKTPEQAMNDGIIGTITDTIGGFVKGLGVSFVSAFNALFMVDGHLNSLSIFLLCISGIGLGYGVVRFTTHLFRKET